MLTSIGLKNFKSYQQASLPLATVTFLIGANASGKSNALEAIRLLHWLATGVQLDDIGRGMDGNQPLFRGYAEDLFMVTGEPIEFEVGFSTAQGHGIFKISIEYKKKGLQIAAEELSAKTDSAQNAGDDAGAGSVLRKVPCYRTVASTISDPVVEIGSPMDGEAKKLLILHGGQPVFYQLDALLPGIASEWSRQLRQHLRNVLMLDAHPAAMRGYVNMRDDQLEENGRNLSAVLCKICRQGDAAKQQLLDFIRSLPEQDIVDIQFITTERHDVMLRLKERFGAHERIMDAPLLSDGTLRVLAIAAMLLTAPEGALVIIEEIDNGVHPSRAEMLVQQMTAIANQRQLRLLLTSHNPALLDALPDQALADVLCCYRDPKEGGSRLLRLGDMARYPELVAQGTLGYLMTQRVLDRFLKDDRGPEQHRAAALDWLTQFSVATPEESA